MEQIVKISAGEIVLIKPKAGIRNKAIIKAEEGREKASQTVFITNLIPHCIKSHPFGAIPVSKALDNLEMEEYDAVAKALGDLMKPVEEIAKNSEKPSE